MTRPCPLFLRSAIWLLPLLVSGSGSLSARQAGWYLEGTVGQTSLDTQFGRRHPKWFDDDDRSASLEVGRQLNRYLALQVGYHDLGAYRGFGSPCPEDAEACIERLASLGLCVEGEPCLESLVLVEADLWALSLSLVPRWPIGKRFSLYGKVGLIDWEGDIYHRTTFGRSRLDEFSDSDLLTGIGLYCALPKRLGVLLEYRQQDLDLDSTSLGIRWRF